MRNRKPSSLSLPLLNSSRTVTGILNKYQVCTTRNHFFLRLTSSWIYPYPIVSSIPVQRGVYRTFLYLRVFSVGGQWSGGVGNIVPSQSSRVCTESLVRIHGYPFVFSHQSFFSSVPVSGLQTSVPFLPRLTWWGDFFRLIALIPTNQGFFDSMKFDSNLSCKMHVGVL